MRQFIRGSDSAFADLARQARDVCVVFHGEEMPPGSTPAYARVGFEADASDHSAVLFVDRGVICRRCSDDVRRWLEAGELRFPDFDGLKRWIRGPLARCYAGAATGRDSAGPPACLSEPTPDPRQLTDLDVVRQEQPDHDRALFLDEGCVPV